MAGYWAGFTDFPRVFKSVMEVMTKSKAVILRKHMLTELKPVDELNHAQLDTTVVEHWHDNKFNRWCKTVGLGL